MTKINTEYSGAMPPFIEKIGGDILVRFNITFNEDTLMYQYKEIIFNRVLPLNFKDIILNYYNSQCDLEILQGLKYEGEIVWLSSENQFNYKAAYDFCFQKQIMSLPFESPTFKLGSNNSPVYKTFEDMEELTTFIQACFGHIQSTLVHYWNIKDSINWDDYTITE